VVWTRCWFSFQKETARKTPFGDSCPGAKARIDMLASTARLCAPGRVLRGGYSECGHGVAYDVEFAAAHLCGHLLRDGMT
jgi:hypothetical protein